MDPRVAIPNDIQEMVLQRSLDTLYEDTVVVPKIPPLVFENNMATCKIFCQHYMFPPNVTNQNTTSAVAEIKPETLWLRFSLSTHADHLSVHDL